MHNKEPVRALTGDPEIAIFRLCSERETATADKSDECNRRGYLPDGLFCGSRHSHGYSPYLFLITGCPSRVRVDLTRRYHNATRGKCG